MLIIWEMKHFHADRISFNTKAQSLIEEIQALISVEIDNRRRLGY